MSARNPRRKRWEQWNRRPATRAMASQVRRERYTIDELTEAIDTSMNVGEMEGRRRGERDLYRALADMCDEPLDLVAWVGGQVLAQDIDNFLLVERAVRADPDRMNQIAEAVELDGDEGKEALERLAREWGVFPDGERDDLLDVAEAAGVTPLADVDGEELVDELEAWLRDRDGDG